MATTIRNKFKATAISDLKKIVNEEDSKIDSGSSGSDFLQIEDGTNKFRIFPKHPTEKSFYHIRSHHWITVEGDDGEDKRTTVLNARIHAGISRDPIEEYINFVKEKLSGSDDADDLDKIKKLVDWKTGMRMQSSWLCYAKKINGEKSVFGILEIKKTVRDALNNESIIEDEDEAITIDPFTDPDEGKPVIITYNSKAKKSTDYYKVQTSKKTLPLTDEELEAFEKLTPLSQLQMLTYDNKMFEKVLSGLEFFDEQYEIELFDTDEFQEIISEIRDELQDGESESTKKSSKKASTKKSSKKVEVEEDDEEEEKDDDSNESGDEFDGMDRTELKKYIKENELDITIKKSMSDDDLRDLIRAESVDEEEEDEEDDEEETEEVEEETEDNDEEEEEEKTSKTSKPKSLEEIKAELRKRKK